jgi:hypothetical protein
MPKRRATSASSFRVAWHRMPVGHESRRSGRPFTLVLIKTDRLFRDHAQERERRSEEVRW